MPRIVSARPVGRIQTYDLEVDHPDHQFYLVNGLLTSNSHAVSYAYVSYYCAYLLHYYGPEWLCAYMESVAGNDRKRSKALTELRTFGVSIVPIDINHASEGWTILDDRSFMPSFLSVKGIGDAAIREIFANRPYRNVRELLVDDSGRWKHSKFNKSALSALIRIGAFGSLDIVGPGKVFESYRHMHETLVGRITELKRAAGRKISTFDEVLERVIAETAGCGEWPRSERVDWYRKLVGTVSPDLIVPRGVRERLNERGIGSIDEIAHDDDEVVDDDESMSATRLVWFYIEKAEKKLTKNGKPYMLLHAAGELGMPYRTYCWGVKPEAVASFRANSVCVAKVERTEFGFACKAWELRFVGGHDD